MLVGSLFSIMSPYLPLSTLMSIVGAVVCYFFIYLIPTKIHFSCLYTKRDSTQERLVESVSSLDETNVSITKCSHQQSYADVRSKVTRYLVYGLLNLVGLTIMASGLVSTIRDILQ